MATNVTAGSAQDNLDYDDGWTQTANGTMSTTTANSKACLALNGGDTLEVYFMGLFGRSGGAYSCDDFSDSGTEYHTSLVQTDDYEGVLCYWSYSSKQDSGVEWCLVEGPYGGTTLALTRYIYYTASPVALPDADLNTGTIASPTSSPSIYTPTTSTSDTDVTITAGASTTADSSASGSASDSNASGRSATAAGSDSSDSASTTSKSKAATASSSSGSTSAGVSSARSNTPSSATTTAASTSTASSSSGSTIAGMSSSTFYALIAVGVIVIFVAGGFVVWYCFRPVKDDQDAEGESVALSVGHGARRQRSRASTKGRALLGESDSDEWDSEGGSETGTGPGTTLKPHLQLSTTTW